MAKLYSMAGTGYAYYKRRLRIAPKLEMVKYDPLGRSSPCHGPELLTTGVVRAHVLFTESRPAIPENFHLTAAAEQAKRAPKPRTLAESS